MSLTSTAPPPATASAPAADDGGHGLTAHLRGLVAPVLVTLAFLALWEFLSREDIFLAHRTVPPVTTILGKLVTDVQHHEIWAAVWETVRAWGLGMIIVIAGAVPLGLLLGSSKIAYHASHLTVEFLRTIPAIAALPFLILVYGAGTKLTVVLVILSAVWPLLIQTMYGVHDVDPVTRETGRVYGLSRVGQFRRIVVPSAMPYIATGLRLAGVLGLIVALSTSLIAGGRGLGYEIGTAGDSGQVPLMWARIVLAGFLGLAITAVLLAFERRALRWHPSQRKDQ